MKHLSIMIKPASSLCNMRCRYCFYADISHAREVRSYGIMSDDVMNKILNSIFKDVDEGDTLSFAFQGGEPSIAGLPWFRKFTENAAQRRRNITLQYAFQTNGLLLDDSWCDFFREYNFLIGLSMDCGKRFHDRNRFSASGEGTYDKVLEIKKMLDEKKVEYNILCVLTNVLAKEPEKVWNFIINNNIRYIQFIPCLEPPGEGSYDRENILRPAQFAHFYSRLLPRWIAELDKGNYISVKLYDDVVNYYLKNRTTACGINGQCHNQYVVEADGGVYPCDFFAFDQYRTGNLVNNTLRDNFNSLKTYDFVTKRPALPKLCNTCEFFDSCHGGCKRMSDVMYAGNGAICGYQSFLRKCLGPLEEAVRRAFL